MYPVTGMYICGSEDHHLDAPTLHAAQDEYNESQVTITEILMVWRNQNTSIKAKMRALLHLSAIIPKWTLRAWVATAEVLP